MSSTTLTTSARVERAAAEMLLLLTEPDADPGQLTEHGDLPAAVRAGWSMLTEDHVDQAIGQFDHAVRALQAVPVPVRPAVAGWAFLAYSGRGIAFDRLGRSDAARADLAAALRCDPGDVDVESIAACHELLAHLCHVAGDDRGAYSNLRLAHEMVLLSGPVEPTDEPDHDAGPMVIVGDRSGALEQLVDLRTRQLRKALVDLRDVSDHASLDPLTGLVNRARFREVLLELVATRGRCAVFAIDVDRFGRVNETLGHAAGDAFLIEMARRLPGAVRSTDLVARWGGDEFVVLIAGVAEPAAVLRVGDALRHAVSVPCSLGVGEQLVPSVSIGVAVAPDGSTGADDLLRHADTALERAKARGKDRVELFGDHLGVAAHRRFDVERLLHRALDDELFELHYQPVHSNDASYPLAAEALLRLRHPDGRLLAPGAFLDVAEETGLARPIGTWVLGATCAAARRWLDDGEEFRVAVNVSASQLDEDFAALVLATLSAHRLPPHLLVLELTEHALLEANDDQVESLTSLRSHGVRIALDDFGTSYSSLTHLRRFPVDVVKIDRSFVGGMLANAEDMAIVQAIVDLSKTFGFRVIAEGIETAQQLDVQRRLGCHGAQGFLIGRPKPAAAFAELLATHGAMGRLVGLVA